LRILFDTHLVVWAAYAPAKLPRLARDHLDHAATTPVVSVVTIWEVAIKAARGRADFEADPHVLRRAMADHGWEELPVTGEHALAVTALPALHGDPFDRMLVAQATAEGMPLLTADKTVARYPGPVRLV
jgi:PIN domain nuclease of toxin-antitoxin system